MKRKVIIAGAGHGGLVCGAILAEKGFDVTVYEAKKRREIGHDHTDVFPISCFDAAGIPRPPKNRYTHSHSICYVNPAGSVRIQMPERPRDPDVSNSVMDRKYLINYLIRYAESKGVRFRFDTKVVCPVTDGERVLGMVIKKGEKMTSVLADLVIDSAGVDSPLRSLMPSKFGILNTFGGNQIFTAYRAFYERISDEEPENKYTVHLGHMYEPGLSWVISEKGYFDILIGRFSENLTEQQIEEALIDLRKENPAMGEKVIRGGKVARIPVRRTIPLLVADGYAAIGDCAGMTNPMIGSGIANSITAGKYLADAVLGDNDRRFTAETLWSYQYNYFTNIGNKLVLIDKLRSMTTGLSGADVDYLFEKEILSASLFARTTGASSEKSILQTMQKAVKTLPKLPMVANVTRTFARVNTLRRVLADIPKEYDEVTVRSWAEKYEAL